MKDSASEYIATGHEQNRDSILAARARVLCAQSIDFGARCLFLLLLDLSVQRATMRRLGSVTIRQCDLAEKLGASDRTISNWAKSLVFAGEIWLTPHFQANRYPVNTYHIEELDPRSKTDKRDLDGVVKANGHTRQRPCSTRNTTGKFCRYNLSGELLNEPQDIAADSGSPLPLTAEARYRSERKPVTAPSGSPLPLTAEAGCRYERKPVTAVNGSPLPSSAEAGCRLMEAKGESSSDLEGGKVKTAPPKEISQWQKKLEGLYPRELKEIKAGLLAQQAGLNPTDPETRSDRQDIKNRLEMVETALFGAPAPKKQSPAKFNRKLQVSPCPDV